jgi:NAD(P)-dependent dehydrogenase (short-subunit alcohol dehydrogenase family)
MKIILLGSKGLVGRSVFELLQERKFNVIGCDITDLNLENEDQVKDFFKKNPADILINLFGKNDHIEHEKKNNNNVQNITEQEIEEYFHVNTVLLFRVCRIFCSVNGYGKVYNFSSLYGHHVPNPKYYKSNEHKSLGYVLSKAGAVMLTKYLAVHYPDFVFIDIVMGGVENGQPDSFRRNFYSDLVIQRLLGPREVGELLIGLFNVDYITGTSIFIDGGKHLT